MTLDGPPSDASEETSRLITPRWVTPALFALAGAAAIACLVDGRVLFGLVIAALAAVALLLTLIFHRQVRAFNERRAAAHEASYGTLTLIGVAWMSLGVWSLTVADADVILGWVAIAFGLITVFAYAPGYLRARALARSL